jgi:hypothetical protein
VVEDVATKVDSENTQFARTAPGPSAPSDPQSPTTPAHDLARAADPALTPDLAQALLQRHDLPAEAIEQLSKNASVTKSRKVRIAIAAHPRTPRRLALRLIRALYTFDLMQFALQPVVAADLKRAADEMLVTRLTSVTLGERISLARRASPIVAAALLLDKEARVWQTALGNSRLTEAAIIKALLREHATAAFVEAISHHAKWSPRKEIRLALLRNEKTPLARALEFARTLSPPQLRDVLHNSRLPEKVKRYLRRDSRLEK